MAILATLLTSSDAMERPSFHTNGTPVAKPTDELKPGEYWWNPQLLRKGG